MKSSERQIMIQNRKYKYILWDMDGTLINSEPQHYRAWMRTFKEKFGIGNVPWDIYKGCIGAKRTKIVEIMKENYGVDIDTPGINETFEAHRAEVVKEEGFAPIPGVKEVLEALKGAGFTMAIASSSHQEIIREKMTGIGCIECFEILFSSDRVKNGKPAPDTFLECADTLGAPYEECIVVEDSENGTLAARAAGMYCIGFVNPGSGDQNLSAADALVKDLREIPALLEG